MITREQVADLRAGDVVELTSENWPPGSVIRGALVEKRTGVRTYGSGYEDKGKILTLCGTTVRWGDGAPTNTARSLTVISRAPRPLYVNHDRAEPVAGDVVRDCDGDIWSRRPGEWFVAIPDDECGDLGPEDFKPLTLLVDGTTGQVVP